MPIPEDVYLPSKEELTVPEINVTSGVFRAASLYMGRYCDNISKEYMLCKKESRRDPRRCINEGKEVTRCGMEFFQKVKTNCYDSFTKYWQCVDRSANMNFKFCRESQKGFDECVGQALGIERPDPGYFSKVRVIDTDRPRPQFEEIQYPQEVQQMESEPLISLPKMK